MSKLFPTVWWQAASVLILGAYTSFAVAQANQQPPPAASPAGLKMLKEISEQRRPRLLFPNEQSIFHGARHSFVNTSAGNLSFVRRDLVLASALPVQIARVYDSQTGWRLSVGETLQARQGGWFDYTNAANVTVRIRPRRAGVDFLAPQPSPLIRFEADAAGFAALYFSDGLVRRFKMISGVLRLSSVSDRNGNNFAVRYSAGRPSRIEARNGRYIDILRDNAGRLLSVSDEQGRRVEYAHDTEGRLVSVRDVGGAQWSYEYDTGNRLIRIIDPLGAELLAVQYDAAGRVSQLVRDNLVSKLRYSNETTWVAESTGSQTRYEHDTRGAVTSVFNAMGVTTRVARNAAHQVTALHRNGHLQYSFQYRSDGKLESMTDHTQAAAALRTFGYDESGRLSAVTDASGARLLGYDERGNPVALRHGERWEQLHWDSRGGLSGWQNNAGHDYQFAYNGDGRLVVVADRNGQTTNFFYQADGKLASAQLANGARHEYDYNAAGLRSAVRRWDGSAVLYDHDAAGRLVNVTVVAKEGDQHSLDIDFDGRALVSGISTADAAINIRYNDAGNALDMRMHEPSGKERTLASYAHDGAGRLTNVVIGGGEPLSIHYAPGESNVVSASDAVTGLARHAWSGGGFGGGFGAAGFAPHGAVELDSSSREFRPLNGEGVSVPFDAVSETLAETRVLGLGGVDPATIDYFEAASNRMFTPQEYFSVNCCGFPCEELGGFHCRITCFPPPADDPPLPPFIQLILDRVVVANSAAVHLEMSVVGGILSQIDTFGPGFDGGLENVTGPFSLIVDPRSVPANQPGAFIVRGSNGQSIQVTTQRALSASVNDNVLGGLVTAGGVVVPVVFNQHAQDETEILSVSSYLGVTGHVLAGESFLTLSNIMRPPLPSHYAQWNAEHQYWSSDTGNHNLVAMTPWNSPGPSVVPAGAVTDLRHAQASRVYDSDQPLKGIFYTRYIAMESSAGPVAVLGLIGNTLEVPLN